MTGRDLHAVQFFEDGTGWVGADAGVVYRTMDGGLTWSLAPTGISRDVVGLHFPTKDLGFAVSDDLGFARTMDGGETWETANAGGRVLTAHTLHFFNESTGLVIGQSGTLQPVVYLTDDGGETWEGIFPPASQSEGGLYGVHFLDNRTGWAAGGLYDGTSLLVHTTDGGRTWTQHLPALSPRPLVDVAFATPDVGVAVGLEGTAFRTTDGGATWSLVPLPTPVTLRDVDFVDETRGWIVGADGIVLHTVDGGLSWTLEASGTTGSLVEASFTIAGEGWAVSDAGVLRHRVGSALDALPDDPLAELASPHPPIVVAGDDGFEGPLSGVTSGSGTAEDPYVIEGWDIVPTGVDAISLTDTRAHVVIRGNVLHGGAGGTAAIRLTDAENVTIHDNTIEGTGQGLVATGGRGLHVEANRFDHVADEAVRVDGARDVILKANRVQAASGHALFLRGVTNATVLENEAAANAGDGLHVTGAGLTPSTGVSVVGNAFTDNANGIRIVNAEATLVEANDLLINARYGMRLDRAPDTVLRVNGFVANTDGNLLALAYSTDLLVEENLFMGPIDHVFVNGASGPVIRANAFEGAGRAAALQAVTNGLVEANEIRGKRGIYLLVDTSGTIIRENDLEVDFSAIWMLGAHNNVAENNTVRGGGDLALLDASHDNILQGNVAWNSTSTAISVAGGSERAIVRNNTVHGANTGIAVNYHARDALVTGNRVVDGGDGIVIARHVDGARVLGNVIENVSGVGLHVYSVVDVEAADNHVRNAAIGLRLSSEREPLDNIHLHHNRVSESREAILEAVPGYGGNLVGFVLEDNDLANNAVGLRIMEVANATVRGNNLPLLDAPLLEVEASTVDARLNWWGHSGDPGDAVQADTASAVTYDPWLTEPNPDAGPRPLT